jgi:hypothetical protein
MPAAHTLIQGSCKYFQGHSQRHVPPADSQKLRLLFAVGRVHRATSVFESGEKWQPSLYPPEMPLGRRIKDPLTLSSWLGIQLFSRLHTIPRIVARSGACQFQLLQRFHAIMKGSPTAIPRNKDAPRPEVGASVEMRKFGHELRHDPAIRAENLVSMIISPGQVDSMMHRNGS